MVLFRDQLCSTNDSSSGDDQETGSTPSLSSKHSPSRCFFLSPYLDFNPVRIIMAEMVGTFIMMFSVCGIIASTQLTKGQVGLMEYAATAGFSVVVVIFSIGHISGAHVNPAVTLAFATVGSFPWSRVPFYVTAQTVGAVAATLAGKSIYGVKVDVMATRPALGCASAFCVELISTCFVVFVASALTCGADQSVGNLSGFVVGTVIALGVLITAPVSGGSMNPARSIGPAVVAWDFKDIWVYVTAPVVGATAGVLIYRLLRLKDRPCATPNPPPLSTLLPNSLHLRPA